jgi:hypothetical protein
MKKMIGATALALALGLSAAAFAPISAQAADNAAITGKVYSDNFTPVKNVTVEALIGTTVVKTTKSDAKGAYYLRGLAAGTYTLKYSDSTARYLTDYFGDDAAATPQAITLTAGEKRSGTSENLTHAAKITGRVFVNGTEADTRLGAVEARLFNSKGELVEKQAVSPTFKFYYLPADEYSLKFCTPNDDQSWLVCADYPSTITVVAGQAVGRVYQVLQTQPGAVLPTIVEGTTSPKTVKYGKNVTITANVLSYSYLENATASIQHHNRIVETTAVVNRSATFVVDSDDWVKSKSAKKIKVIFNASADAARSASFTSFKVK